MDWATALAWLSRSGSTLSALGPWLWGIALLSAALLLALLTALRRGGTRVPNIARHEAKEAPRGLCARLRAWAARLLDTLDYLATRREWRYRQPWLLMLGEEGAGKTSLIASVAPTWRHRAPPKAHELHAAGTKWSFLRHGVVIDLEGRLPAAEEGSEEAESWPKSLAELNALRPERPLDGIVLCVSARALLSGKRSERMALAENVNRQLVGVQTAFEFALPIYVAITQCDGIPGFSAFWKSQSPARREELFGYSATAEDRGRAPSAWADAAFAVVGERLRELQVDTAAHKDDIDDVDGFFLFPGRFKDLREPLGQWLETVFRVTAWQRGHLFRGLYFTGSTAAEGECREGVRKDIDFVDALFSAKALREPALAEPTRSGVWSRNGTIRALQLAGLSFALILLVGMGLAARQFARQVDAIVAGVAALERTMPSAGESCLEREAIYAMLTQVSRIDTRSRYWSIPLSWLDSRPTRRSAEVIGRTAVEQTLMPTFSCLLSARARTLLASADDLAPTSPDADELSARRAAFQHLIADVREMEDNLARYEALALLSESLDERSLIEMLDRLARYAFGAALPEAVWRRGGVLDDAFHHIRDVPRPALPEDLRRRLASRIESNGDSLRVALAREVALGDTLLKTLGGGDTPVLDTTRRLAVWLAWVQQSWLGSSAGNNPCRDIAEASRSDIDTLIARYGYSDGLRATLRAFDAQHCHRPEMETLAGIRLEPYGPMFVPGDGGLMLAPALHPELVGIPALVALPFMRLNPVRPFECLGASALWRADAIAEAAGYLADYEAFATAQPAATLPGGGRPLYDRLARHSLAHALDDTLRRAQHPLPISPSRGIGLAAIGEADQRLARVGDELAAGLDSLQTVLDAYVRYGFSAGGAAVRQCARAFAADNLGAIDALADGNRLYSPPPATGSDTMFELGSLPATKEFLARQLARAQVLGSYATPFVSLLSEVPGVDDAWRDTPQTAPYWRDTLAEINLYTQGKDATGQVANLDNYFIVQLAGMTYANCAETLAGHTSPEYGNDLFSERRRTLERQVRLRCEDRNAAQAAEVYDALAIRFNRDLAGRYPFGPPDSRDASPVVVRAFFRDYAADHERIAAALVDLGGDRWRSASRFVDELDAVAAFLAGNVNAPGQIEAVGLSANFPAEAARSVGGEQLLSWRLAVDDAQSVFPNGLQALEWYPGQTIALELHWAERSEWRPIADPGHADLDVRDAVARFQADGPWALLRFIDRHRVPGIDPRNPGRIVLGFNVPVQRTRAEADGSFTRDRTRVFMTMAPTGIDPNTHAPETLALPARFPRGAPSE